MQLFIYIRGRTYGWILSDGAMGALQMGSRKTEVILSGTVIKHSI